MGCIRWIPLILRHSFHHSSQKFPEFPRVVLGFIHFGPAAVTISIIAMRCLEGFCSLFEASTSWGPPTNVSWSLQKLTLKNPGLDFGRKAQTFLPIFKLRPKPQIKTHILPENGTVTASLCSNWRTGRMHFFAHFEWQTSDITSPSWGHSWSHFHHHNDMNLAEHKTTGWILGPIRTPRNVSKYQPKKTISGQIIIIH